MERYRVNKKWKDIGLRKCDFVTKTQFFFNNSKTAKKLFRLVFVNLANCEIIGQINYDFFWLSMYLYYFHLSLNIWDSHLLKFVFALGFYSVIEFESQFYQNVLYYIINQKFNAI